MSIPQSNADSQASDNHSPSLQPFDLNLLRQLFHRLRVVRSRKRQIRHPLTQDLAQRLPAILNIKERQLTLRYHALQVLNVPIMMLNRSAAAVLMLSHPYQRINTV
jgi:hypothetical protein